MFGFFSSLFFCPGFSKTLDDQDQLWLKMLANLEGEGEGEGGLSIKNFDKILDSTTYAKSKLIEDAMKMLVAVSKVAIKQAGYQPCIVLMGYTYTAELVRYHDWPITENTNSKDRFLVRVLHKINREIQIAFSSIYDQVCHARTIALIINKNIITTIYAEIKIMFRQIIQNKVADFHLPVQLENNSARGIKNN